MEMGSVVVHGAGSLVGIARVFAALCCRLSEIQRLVVLCIDLLDGGCGIPSSEDSTADNMAGKNCAAGAAADNFQPVLVAAMLDVCYRLPFGSGSAAATTAAATTTAATTASSVSAPLHVEDTSSDTWKLRSDVTVVRPNCYASFYLFLETLERMLVT